MSFVVRPVSPQPVYRVIHTVPSPQKIINIEQSQRKYQQLVQQNLWLKQQIQRKRHGHTVDPQHIYYQQIAKRVPYTADENHQKNDMILWGMLQRNRYLEAKLAKLKKQQAKQAKTIKKIQHSEEWQNRHVCVPGKCYHEKYMQLLRVRSPFF